MDPAPHQDQVVDRVLQTSRLLLFPRRALTITQRLERLAPRLRVFELPQLRLELLLQPVDLAADLGGTALVPGNLDHTHRETSRHRRVFHQLLQEVPAVTLARSFERSRRGPRRPELRTDLLQAPLFFAFVCAR